MASLCQQQRQLLQSTQRLQLVQRIVVWCPHEPLRPSTWLEQVATQRRVAWFEVGGGCGSCRCCSLECVAAPPIASHSRRRQSLPCRTPIGLVHLPQPCARLTQYWCPTGSILQRHPLPSFRLESHLAGGADASRSKHVQFSQSVSRGINQSDTRYKTCDAVARTAICNGVSWWLSRISIICNSFVAVAAPSPCNNCSQWSSLLVDSGPSF